MTRKCALCKESNYKNVYSFFSAPKDPIMRKCWEDALSMDVTDDTFICSKHFHQEDIVTHWVSGQPPHVITIKYKKCRLRPSAVPIIGIEFQNNIQNASTDDDTFELRVNRNESSVAQVTEPINNDKANTRYELSYSQGKKKCRVKEKKRTDEDFILIPEDDSYDAHVSDVKQERVAMQEQTFLIPREDSLLQDESEDYDGAVRDYILRTEQKKWHNLQSKNQQAEVDVESAKRMKTIDESNQENERDDKVVVEDHIYLTSELLNSSQDGECVDVWETSVLENIRSDNEQVIESITMDDCTPESMLFEDFLEVCTEANLPKGWIANVIPKGHETTIVYSFTSATNSSIPFVEKQVFLKSDMMLHFGTSNVEINPFEHNLIREGKDTRVQTLTDIEDVIEEFDQRHICEAMSDEMLESDKNLSSVAIREGSKWRHLECPVLLGEGELVCTRCRSLSQMKIDGANKQNKLDVENVNPEMVIENVSEFELSPSASTSNLMAAIDNLNIPEIRKIMMKECLKTSTELDGQKSVKFSKTWIFLCVLLYIESPRMYRYMLLNNYLCLPPLFTIKRYLHRIKTEPRFYNYFQRSIEPFQPTEKKDTDAKSEET